MMVAEDAKKTSFMTVLYLEQIEVSGCRQAASTARLVQAYSETNLKKMSMYLVRKTRPYSSCVLREIPAAMHS